MIAGLDPMDALGAVLDPRLTEAWDRFQTGAWDEAAVMFAAIEQDETATTGARAEAAYGLGQVLLRQGDVAQAVTALTQAAKVNRNVASLQATLGMARAWIGDHTGATEGFEAALALDPADQKTRLSLIKLLTRPDSVARAAAITKEGLALAPDDIELSRAMAEIYRTADQPKNAVRAYNRLLNLAPTDVPARLAVGHLQIVLGNQTTAAEHFRKAVALQPENVEALDGLADTWRFTGRVEDARKVLSRRAHCTNDPAARAAAQFKAAQLQPVIAGSSTEVDTARRRFSEVLAAGPPLPIAEPWRDGYSPNFYLSYQAGDDRNLQESLARYYLAGTLALGEVAPHVGRAPSHRNKRIRVGLVSNYFNNHTIGYLCRGMVEHLDRARFDVTLFRTPASRDDQIARAFAERAPVVDLPADLAEGRRILSEAELDVVHYPEIGMDHYSYFLAFARLGRLQSVTWGHPVTTGIPNIDLFLSVDAMEPSDASHHYSERLIRLQRLSIAVARPAVGKEISRAALGMDPARPAYVCAQSLFKVHPDFDEIVRGILTKDRVGLVYFVSFGADADALFSERLKQSLGENYARVRVLPRVNSIEFLELLRAADVLLDIPQWSGGKTSLESFAMGTPIVHWPGAFMRGRHTRALYRRMGVEGGEVGSAAQYIDTAVRLVHDAAFRKDIRGQIADASGRLYDDIASIREIENVWVDALTERRG